MGLPHSHVQYITSTNCTQQKGIQSITIADLARAKASSISPARSTAERTCAIMYSVPYEMHHSSSK